MIFELVLVTGMTLTGRVPRWAAAPKGQQNQSQPEVDLKVASEFPEHLCKQVTRNYRQN